MDSELFAALLWKLHEAEVLLDIHHPRGPARFCRHCRARVEFLVPTVYDHIEARGGLRDD